MIDFPLLENLWNSAKNKSEGKPLDKCTGIHTGNRSGDNMRNCRLHKVGDKFHISLHGNLIADIERLSYGARVTVHNATEYPTITTGNRLSAILNVNVWVTGGKLRCTARNIKHLKEGRSYRQYPPLVSGQVFECRLTGLYCMNPEVVAETRYSVDRAEAAPVLAYLKKIKDVGVPIARIGAASLDDVRALRHMDLSEPFTDINYELVCAVMQRGHASWRSVFDNAQQLKSLEVGLLKLKEILYSKHRVRKPYTYSFAHYFMEVPDAQQ